MGAPSLAPSLWRRMACWLYEGVLLLGLVFIAGYLFGTLSQTRHALDNRHALQVFLFIVFGIYFVWLWARGQTLAMKTWHITVVDSAGLGLTQARALLRYVLAWLWFLPALAGATLMNLAVFESLLALCAWVLLWAMLSYLHPQRQFWHDALAGTQLISTQPL